jgi:hypothetical protein
MFFTLVGAFCISTVLAISQDIHTGQYMVQLHSDYNQIRNMTLVVKIKYLKH